MTAAEQGGAAGRAEGRMRPVNVRLSVEQRQRLQAEAAGAGMSLSDWMRYKLGFEVALPELPGGMLRIDDVLAERLAGVWQQAGYVSLEEFVAEALEGAVHRELAALRDRVAAVAAGEVAVLGLQTRRFAVQQVACRHPADRRTFKAGQAFCELCGGRIGRA